MALEGGSRGGNEGVGPGDAAVTEDLREPVEGGLDLGVEVPWVGNHAACDGEGRVYTTFRSLIASCHLHGINPQTYLEEVLRLAPHWPATQALQLSPKYWSQTRAALSNEQLESLQSPWASSAASAATPDHASVDDAATTPAKAVAPALKRRTLPTRPRFRAHTTPPGKIQPHPAAGGQGRAPPNGYRAPEVEFPCSLNRPLVL